MNYGIDRRSLSSGNWHVYDDAGLLHCDNGPAVYAVDDSYKAWYQHGVRHREGGLPAVLFSHHRASYYEYGLLHREDGPAVINFLVERWNINGQQHRLDGPAVYSVDSEDRTRDEYWVNGVEYHTTTAYEEAVEAFKAGLAPSGWYVGTSRTLEYEL